MVRLDKGDFVGKAALEQCDQRRRTWGLRVHGGVARIGRNLMRNGAPVGQVCSTAWSPFQQCGVAIVRLDDPEIQPGTTLDVTCQDGESRACETCNLPMYDPKGDIPRGKTVDIPDLPEGEAS
jgi:aminomethyltransferase